MKRPGRGHHRGQHGFTLVEVIVSIILLAIIGSAIGATVSIGFRVLLAPGSSNDRLAGAHDQMALEQVLANDVGRAACIVAPVTGDSTAYGSCGQGFTSATPPGTCSAALLCIGWVVFADGNPESGLCQVAAYTSGAAFIARSEYAGGSLVSADRVTTDPARIAAGPSPSLATFTASSGESWISSLTLRITSNGVPAQQNPPNGVFQLRPLAADPAGSIADISQSGTPVC